MSVKVDRKVDTIIIEMDVEDAYRLWAVADTVVDKTDSYAYDTVFAGLGKGLFNHLSFKRMLERYRVSATVLDEGEDDEETFVVLEKR